MHQLITGSDISIPAVCYACRLWCPLPCHKWVWLNWYLLTLGWRLKASITAMSCCLSRCFQQSNVSQNVLYAQNNMLLTAKLVIFLCSVISQGKVIALDRWGGKWNQISMTHRLTTNYAKNYCNRTLIVKVTVENVVTCFFWTRCSCSCTHVRATGRHFTHTVLPATRHRWTRHALTLSIKTDARLTYPSGMECWVDIP